MTNKLIKLGLVSTVVLASAVLGQCVQAANVNDISTKGEVEFMKNDNGEITPTDPDPDPEVITPIEPGETPLPGGALRFDYVPQISFGKNYIEADKKSVFSKFLLVTPKGTTAKVIRPTFVEVTDVRGGTQGWSVSVANDGVFRSETGSEFSGAVLSLSKPTKYSRSGQNAETGLEANAVILGNGQPVEIMKADSAKEQGYGKWQVVYGSETVSVKGDDDTDRNPAVKLQIPMGKIIKAAETYKTTLVWTLADAR